MFEEISKYSAKIYFVLHYQFGPATNKSEVLQFNEKKYNYQLKRNNIEFIKTTKYIKWGENQDKFKENILNNILTFIDNIIKSPELTEKISKILIEKFTNIENFYYQNKDKIDNGISKIVDEIFKEFINYKHSYKRMFYIESTFPCEIFIEKNLTFEFNIEIV